MAIFFVVEINLTKKKKNIIDTYNRDGHNCQQHPIYVQGQQHPIYMLEASNINGSKLFLLEMPIIICV